MPPQAIDDDAVHIGKLPGSESVNPSLGLVPFSDIVPAYYGPGWDEDVVRLTVQGRQTSIEEIMVGLEDGGVLTDDIEKGSLDLGVAGVIVRECQSEVGRLIVEPEFE